ncbi:MAG TPA: LCP family protein [Firmicutes bacterium]|nr:LCP family protein [Bacillota bacterium]
MLPPEKIDGQEQEMMGQREQKRPRIRRLIVLVTIGAVILFSITAAAYLRLQRTASITLSTSNNAPGAGVEQVNVLVMGTDERSADIGRSDTIMLVSFDTRTGDVGIISIPRDTRVRIPGYRYYSKINAAFALGGPQLARATVEELLKVRIDYYIVVDFAGFEKIVDTLGGVSIDVPKRMYYVDRAQQLVIDLQPGVQRLDGHRALGYVRFRNDALGDIALVDPVNNVYEGRIERQLKFVKALAKEALRLPNLLKAPRLLSQVYAAVETDLALDKMVSLALAARKVNVGSVQTHVLPGTTGEIQGVSYWIMNEQAARELLLEVTGEGSVQAPPVKIAVLNGAGIAGIAGKAAERLRQEGFEVVSVANAASFNYQQTMIFARDERREAVDAIAAALGVTGEADNWSATGDIRQNADITVIVGRDWAATAGS